MRPRFLIFVLIVVLLIAALLFWRRPVQPPASTGQPQTAVQSTNAPATTTMPFIAPMSTPPPAVNQSASVTSTNRLKKLMDIVENANAPIDFYGLVIDQNSNPIPGVAIKSGVRHWTMPNPDVEMTGSTTIQLEATSGADGRFELTGATGDGFGILLTKDGYDAEPGNDGFGAVGNYSYANPVIFKMWSTNIHEKLITGKYAFQIIPDGRPYFINLTDGTISESGTGDLKVWIQYTNQVVPGQMSDWSAGIDVINGGLQDATDSAMWLAPADGYVPSFTDSGQIRGGQRGQIGDRHFYLQLQNGNEYGQMTIDLLAPFNVGIPGLVRISYAINPSGSRILR